jgi:uncharacterized membrane protein YraQ (UPF0718 family)
MTGSQVVVLLALMGIALWHGPRTFSQGWRSAIEQCVHFIPMLLLALTLAGFVDVLLPQRLIEQWLGNTAGWRGIGLAYIAGVLTPGGGIIGLSLAATLYNAGASVSVLMTYLTALATMSLLRLPLEVGFFGWRLTLVRIAASLVLPPIAGVIAHWFVVWAK